MDLDKVTLVMDIWEGRPYLDMPTLHENGIRGMIVRLNDTKGTLHMDEHFTRHWSTSEYFYRMPYFIFWPGYTAIEQYQWIIKNKPAEVKVIGIDSELNCKWTNPATVAQVLDDLHFRLQDHGMAMKDYSGSWWWNSKNIAPHPAHANYDYWWGRYPYSIQPDNAHTFSTWENLKKLISQLEWAPGVKGAPVPGPKCRLWQVCSRYFLPGTGGENVDINVFSGSESELKEYFGGFDALPLPPVTESLSFTAECLVGVQNIRSGPGTNYDIVGSVEKGRISPVIGIGGKDVWVQIGENRWVAVDYQKVKYQRVRPV